MLGTRTYRRIPLGVRTSGQNFNRQIDADLADFLYKDIYKFVDDVLIASETKHEHLESLVKIFERLASRGYSVKAKVKILPEEFEFLGQISAPEGIRP
mmetsp:Transcript_2466/g.8344  ORF Transcript_2466/g.8344 Transcript_2466/m.8344 type:complete len:98 (+) Transcript_2466:10-303(+)